jgi:hypothetical protein
MDKAMNGFLKGDKIILLQKHAVKQPGGNFFLKKNIFSVLKK